jgi:hypothetical protein
MHRAVVGSAGSALPLVLAVVALRRRPALFLDLKQGSLGVGASGDAVPFDAGGTGEFLVVDQHHGDSCRCERLLFKMMRANLSTYPLFLLSHSFSIVVDRVGIYLSRLDVSD